jgi:hypothetical protein
MHLKSNLKNPALLLLMVIIFIVTGCSGGGGNNSGPSGTTIVVGSSRASLSLDNPSLQLSGSTPVSVTLKNSDNSPAAGVPVTFSTTLGTLTATGSTTQASTVTVNTDASGLASAVLTAGSTSGQGQLTASATVENKLVSTTALFSVNLPALKLANLRFTNNSSASISYGSSQGITVDVQDAGTGKPYIDQPVDVVFTSTMAAQNKATINSPVTAINGRATTTYTAVTASGVDTITASISGSSLSIPLTVNPLNAGAITFLSASPTTIGLKGMGGVGIQESSKVTFKVVDTSGAPKANQPVTFALNTNVGGITLSASSGSTDSQGTVSTIVQSGVIATPVRVTASTQVGGTTLATQSDQLVISTGVPAQDGFSISVANLNPEAWNIDGVVTAVTARLSDHFHNPVPDGTAVYFTTSGGSIEPACLTVKGSCSVNWTSQAPRPPAQVNSSGQITHNAGRPVVLAYAIGEEGFTDLNGNGLADAGEFTDTSEAFRDDNESGGRDANEPFIDFNGDLKYNTGDAKYNGVLQGPAFVGVPKSKHVFGNHVIVMATSEALISFWELKTNATALTKLGSIAAPQSFFVEVRDLNGNTMPSGTKITVTAPFGTLTGQSSYTVPQNVGFGVDLPLFIAASSSPKPQTGIITVTVTSPGGLVTIGTLGISGPF